VRGQLLEKNVPCDKDGNLVPLMLSDLIRIAQAALTEHGDVPVWVETCVGGYEYNEEHSLPVSDPPMVTRARSLGAYWPGKFSQAFVIEGA
jgi:hypothetical protein